MIHPALFSLNNLDSLAFFTPAFSGGVPALWLFAGAETLMISKAVNLIIFLGLLYFLVRKPARRFFTTRLAEVRATLQQAAVSALGRTADQPSESTPLSMDQGGVPFPP